MGKAVGLSALLRGTAHHAARRRCYLPVDICAKHRVSQEQLYRREADAGVKDAVLEVASRARDHLLHARDLQAQVPAGIARRVLLPAVGTERYLVALESCDFDPFHPRLKHGGGAPAALQLAVWWRGWRGEF